MADNKQILWDAERLARFANAAEVESLREDYGDLFPQNFWNWQVRQFGEGEVVWARSPDVFDRLKNEPPIPFWRAFQTALRVAWKMRFPLEECVRLISCAAVPDRLSGKTDVEADLLSYGVWPYQRVVMFLGVEPWRARFCGACGNRFVADKPARRFCSNTCSGKARQASRAASWNKHGKKWRARSEQKKASRRRGRRTRR